MGYMRHHAIVVTGIKPFIQNAHSEAVRIFREGVTPIVSGVMNGEDSFLVAPDGSKEGWEESDTGDAGRTAFIAWLKPHKGEWPLAWVEVQFGDDERITTVLRHSDQR